MTDLDQNHDQHRIDALAREAGTALRRTPSPDVLLRVHRARRNRQVARATAGGLALVALVAGGTVLLQRDADDQLVPATTPSTVPSTLPSTLPGTTVPVSVPVTTAPDTRVTTLAPTTAPPPVTAPPLAATPDRLYLGTSDVAAEQVQRVVDLDTLEVLRTEPLDDAASRAYTGFREPRFDSTTGITYGLATYPGDVVEDGIPVTDRCGRFPVEVTGAPAGEIALPDRASMLVVSDDGRWVLTVGAATCPVDGLIEPGMNVAQITYDQEIRLFDADDPAAPGRLLWTSPFPERDFNGVQFTPDGRWMAVTHTFAVPLADGTTATGQGLDVIDTSTGQPLPVDNPACDIVSYGQDGAIFVGTAALTVVTRCDDVVNQDLSAEVWALDATQSTAPLIVTIPDVPFESYATVEVWPGLTDVADATFVVTVYGDDLAGVPNRNFLGRGEELTELPFPDARASFGPLPEIVGD